MTTVTEAFPLVPGTLADADALEADLSGIRTVINGQLEMGVNVQAGAAAACDGDTSSPGSSLQGSHADHTHAIRGLEALSADPSARVGREYFNTVTKQTKLCIGVGPDLWVVTGNMSGTDLPTHASRHASGGADALPANSVDQTMFKARTLYQAFPGGDITVSANTWTDVATGLVVTVTGTQLVWLFGALAITNTSGSNSPTVTGQIIDGAGTVLAQRHPRQYGIQGGANDADTIHVIAPVVLSASPTLKLRVNANTTGISVKQSDNTNGSVYAVTRLHAVVG